MKNIFTIVSFSLLITACNKQKSSEVGSRNESIPTLSFSFISEYLHDQDAFTEGLLFHEGKLFESTGASDLPQTRSLFGEVNLGSGNIEVKAELDRNKYFGEGITFLNGRVYQLTYRSRTGFIYDQETYQKIEEFNIPSKEGWGLTTDGNLLIMSDGTDQLTFLDPVSLNVIKKISVRENQYAKDKLNELEYVDGHIYANVWMTNEIVKIDINNGKVVGRLDLTSFATDAKNTFNYSMEMNGIAYNPDRKSFFITGKLWPKIYEIKITL